MHINPLITEIRKGLWAIDVNNIEAYKSIVEKIIAGEPFSFNEGNKATSLMGILDGKGRVRMPDSDGGLEVLPNSIAQVSMCGEIIKHGDYCTYGAVEIVEALDAAQDHPNIDATVLKIDGPGGAVSSIDVFRDFKKRKKKPVVGLLSDALSLHYWVAVEVCDYLIIDGDVSPRVGSVGVMASWLDIAKELAERGIIRIEVYAPESEHKNDAFRLAREGKFELIQQEHLSPLAVKFQGSVIAGRPRLIRETGVLTGKTYYADDALRLGMIDAIGNPIDAINKARGLAMSQKFNSSLK